MHAAALGRKLVYEAFATAKAASDLAGTSVGAQLAFVPEPMAEPAAETRPAVQNGASAIAPRAPEPTPRSAERCRRRPDLDALVDDLG